VLCIPITLFFGQRNVFMDVIRRTEWALRERVKELTCLYGIAHVTQRAGASLSETLQAIVELLPPAWQFPDIACARIVLDGQAYQTDGFRQSQRRQAADLEVAGRRRGMVEVFYARDPGLSESAFLDEERSLIEMIAREVSIHIERCESEQAGARLRDQLRHADRLATLGQLAAGVAHEINEPLSNMLGFAQLAKKVPGVPAQVSGDLEKIVKSCLYAREVIHKLLTFARKMPPEKTSVNLNQIITDGLYFLESRCAKAGIDIVRNLDPALPGISADPTQLHQAIVNLFVNAVQAMPEGGRITIETRVSNEAVLLIVQDTGMGMTESVRQNIFTLFFTTKDVNEGTGLVVGASGWKANLGAAAVYNRASVIGVFESRREQMMAVASGKEQILIVADSPNTLEVLQRNLQSEGYLVFTASNVAGAISILGQSKFDLVITDLKMPKISGLDLVRHVRENLKDTEVMMITGYPPIDGAVGAVKAGAAEYLSKPFTDEELLAAVRGVLEKLRMRRAAQMPTGRPRAMGGLIGESRSMQEVFSAVAKAAPTRNPSMLPIKAWPCARTASYAKPAINRCLQEASGYAPSTNEQLVRAVLSG
jgi:signal transduction histidine kinase/CheY-like chemotaxis protein